MCNILYYILYDMYIMYNIMHTIYTICIYQAWACSEVSPSLLLWPHEETRMISWQRKSGFGLGLQMVLYEMQVPPDSGQLQYSCIFLGCLWTVMKENLPSWKDFEHYTWLFPLHGKSSKVCITYWFMWFGQWFDWTVKALEGTWLGKWWQKIWWRGLRG